MPKRILSTGPSASSSRSGCWIDMQKQQDEEAAAHYRRAMQFHQFDQVHAAIDSLKKAVKISPSYAGAWEQLGVLSIEAGDTNRAREYLRQAISLDADRMSSLARLGRLEYSEGHLEQALSTLWQYFKSGGDELDTLLVLARAAFELNSCSKVLKTTSAIIELDDDFAEVWEMRGLCQAQKSKYNAACISLNVAIDLEFNSCAAAAQVGDICYEAENYERAVDFYRLCLAIDWNQPRVLLRMANSLWFMDRWSAAIPFMEDYTKAIPDDPRGWNNLGVFLREKGEVKRAIECFNHALKLDPGLKAAEKNISTAKHMQVLL
ncbi:tetratricopeptide repeat protein [Candidatus Thorarchaeota archaeon]|nr:MAG: tetratricopeptide repeat protein [Candidatus Thorarchaeota archaeon]